MVVGVWVSYTILPHPNVRIKSILPTLEQPTTVPCSKNNTYPRASALALLARVLSEFSAMAATTLIQTSDKAKVRWSYWLPYTVFYCQLGGRIGSG